MNQKFFIFNLFFVLFYQCNQIVKTNKLNSSDKIIIPIVMTLTENTIKQAVISLTSICETSKKSYNQIYLLVENDFNTSNKDIKLIQNKYFNSSCNISLFILNDELVIREKVFFTEPSLYKLAIPYLFPQYEKILIIEPDTITRSGVTELYNLNMKNNLILGHISPYSEKDNKCEIKSNLVINTSVMVLNVKELRKYNFCEKSIEIINLYKDIHLFDYSIINIVCKGKIGVLPPKFGVLSSLTNINEIVNYINKLEKNNFTSYSVKDYLNAFFNPHIIHFNLNNPFNKDYQGNYQNFFLSYLLRTHLKEQFYASIGIPIIVNYEKERKYLELCHNNMLIHNNTKIYPKGKKKVSVVLAVYNKEKYIIPTLRSIQNQDLQEIEIVIVDDCSTDKSYEILLEEQKKDPRIILVRNEKNSGTIYTRWRAFNHSSSNYVHFMDADDLFCKEEALSSLYKIAKEKDLDVLRFGILLNSQSKFQKILIPKEEKAITQPELAHYFSKNKIGKPLWNKLFSRRVLLDAYNLLGEKRYSTYLLLEEEVLLNNAIMIVAKNYYQIKNIYYCYYKLSDSVMRTSFGKNKIEERLSSFYYSIIYHYEISKDNYEDKFEFNHRVKGLIPTIKPEELFNKNLQNKYFDLCQRFINNKFLYPDSKKIFINFCDKIHYNEIKKKDL